MNNQVIKVKQAESLLSQKIREIYLNQLKHSLDDVSYRLFDRTLIITLEGTITSSEKILKERDCLSLAKQVREVIDRVIQPQIKDILEDILEVKVVDFLSDTTINNNLTAAIAIFEFKPKNI